MRSPHIISHWVSLANGQIHLDGNQIFDAESTEFADFARQAYQFMEISYPKFHKMDALSKLAFLGAEVLLGNIGNNEKDIALLFMNKSGSLDTDLRHQESISNPDQYYPSPAVFVYTLANICLGEVSIRHQFQTESCFFVSDTFDADLMYNYATYLLQSGKCKKVLCAWVEYLQDDYSAVFYLVGQGEGVEHHMNEIRKIVIQ
jgi:hypothetical protein